MKLEMSDDLAAQTKWRAGDDVRYHDCSSLAASEQDFGSYPQLTLHDRLQMSYAKCFSERMIDGASRYSALGGTHSQCISFEHVVVVNFLRKVNLNGQMVKIDRRHGYA